MYRWMAVLMGMLLAGGAWAGEKKTVDDSDQLPEKWSCGKVGARTAVDQLPAFRGIVYDPVSSSFAYISAKDCDNNTAVAKNLDHLDRRRLALTSQKVVLLIMPYSPFDGSLTGEKVSKLGVESEETLFGGAPPDKGAGTTSPPAQPQAGGTSSASALRALHFDFNPPTQSDPAAAQLNRLQQELLKIPNALDAAKGNFATVSLDIGCARNHVRDLPARLSRRIAKGVSDRSFSLARDASLTAIKSESRCRINDSRSIDYQTCLDESEESGPATFDLDARDMMSRLSTTLGKIDDLGHELDSMDVMAQALPDAPTKQSHIKPADWKREIKEVRDAISQYRGYLKDFGKSVTDQVKLIDDVGGEYRAFKTAMTSQAMMLQRKVYSPLASGDGITFTFKRNAILAADGKTELIPAKEATLEVKSTPVSTIRFGTGLVVSWLKNPTFKVGEEDPQTKMKRIAFDDRGNAQVLPSLFVHHYWGARSGLLDRTNFEMLMPTVSLGIPLAKSDPLQQVLIGLDWELITGLELNLGVHWGKVNALSRGHSVGQWIASTTDLSTLQEKRFRAAFYGGIVLNSDAFKKLIGAQESSKQ
jgi:hypothetical protein